MEKDTAEENLEAADQPKEEVISYRLKCTESGNGLSHYIMYGDVPEEG